MVGQIVRGTLELPESDTDKVKKLDWRVTAILIAIWTIAIVVITSGDTNIPISMLIIASAFFVFLIPAMNDIVRSLEQAIFKSGKSDERPS